MKKDLLVIVFGACFIMGIILMVLLYDRIEIGEYMTLVYFTLGSFAVSFVRFVWNDLNRL